MATMANGSVSPENLCTKDAGCAGNKITVDVASFSILVCPLGTKWKDGHSAAAQIVSRVNDTLIIQVTKPCAYL